MIRSGYVILFRYKKRRLLQLNKRTKIDEVAIEVLDEADEEVTDHVVHREQYVKID